MHARSLLNRPSVTGSAVVALTVDIGYRVTNSQSNDAFYRYTSHGMGLGFSIAY
jgi:hypothetical protein